MFAEGLLAKIASSVILGAIKDFIAGFWAFVTGRRIAADNVEKGQLQQQNADLKEAARRRAQDDATFAKIETGLEVIKDDL